MASLKGTGVVDGVAVVSTRYADPEGWCNGSILANSRLVTCFISGIIEVCFLIIYLLYKRHI